MRLHWIAGCFLLGLIIVLDPTHTAGQPPFGGKGGGDGGFGGKGGKGGKKGGGDFGGGNFGGKGGGGGFPGNPGGGFPGGAGGKGGGGGFPGGKGGDPSAMWDRMAQGKDSINLNDPNYGWMKNMMERQGQPVPPDGIVTRQMFLDESAKRMAAMRTGGAPAAPGGPVTMSFSPSGPMPGNPMVVTMGPEGRMNFTPANPGGGGGDRDRGMERLREQDRDGDGRVARAEADRQLQPNFDRIDRDADGFITLDEYRGWYASQNQGRNNGNNGNNNWDPNMMGMGGDMNGFNRMDPRRDAEEPRPVAMRYGHLPQGLPEWFDTDDTTKDGQIALFEWRKAGKSIAEFESMDLNGDGLITADELLRFERKRSDDQRIAAIMDGTPTRSTFAVRGANGKGPNVAPAGIALPGSTLEPVSADRPYGKGPRDGKGPNRDANNEERPYGKGASRDANNEERPYGKGASRDANNEERPKGKGPNRDSNNEERPKGKGKNRDENPDRSSDRDPGDDGGSSGGESRPNPFRKGK